MEYRENTIPCFIADTMLGKLARWLSLLGYDIVYAGIIDDDDLITQACQAGRVILTRDTKLHELNVDVASFLIRSTDHWIQIREVIERFPLQFSETAFSRCSYCNVPIRLVNKTDVEDRLPPLVRQTQDTIYQCPVCNRLYWEASHVDHIRSMLKEHLNLIV